MTRYWVYEDNGGGVHMIIRDTASNAHLFPSLEMALNCEYGKGYLRELIDALHADHDCWEHWDGYDPLPNEPTEAEIICEIEDTDGYDLIAWNDTDDGHDRVDMECIGANGKALLGITDEDEEKEDEE